MVISKFIDCEYQLNSGFWCSYHYEVPPTFLYFELRIYISAVFCKISIALSKEPEDGEGHCVGGRDRDHQGRPQLHAAPSVQGCRPSLQSFTSYIHVSPPPQAQHSGQGGQAGLPPGEVLVLRGE